jgi:hypothetical protein
MTSITGTIRIGEANKACAKIGRRQRGSIFFYYALMIGFVLVGGGLGYSADLYGIPRLFGIELWLVGGWLGIIAYLYFGRKIGLWRFRKRTESKGTPLEMPMHMEAGPDGLVYELAGIYHRAPWERVTELFAAKGYWIFLVNVSPWFAPKRLFANEAAERAFVREALAHMTEESRTRSAKAVKFAEGVS